MSIPATVSKSAPKLQTVTIEQCFIVFISHRWIRASTRAVEYSGRPEPDNAQHEKHRLCVAGIKYLWKKYAKDLPYCFLWIDYACVNQNIYPGEVERENALLDIVRE